MTLVVLGSFLNAQTLFCLGEKRQTTLAWLKTACEKVFVRKT